MSVIDRTDMYDENKFMDTFNQIFDRNFQSSDINENIKHLVQSIENTVNELIKTKTINIRFFQKNGTQMNLSL